MTEEIFTITYGDDSKSIDIGAMTDGITVIGRNIGGGWNNVVGQGNGRYGNSYISTNLSSKVISIEFYKVLRQNEMAIWKETFASAVDSIEGIKQLKFNDQPNRYYNAVVDGEISFDYDVRSGSGYGTINFLVPDGLAHSTVYKTINNATTDAEHIGGMKINDDGNMEITVINEGNIESYPTITINNNCENDYIGIINSDGIFELGNADDPDGQDITSGSVTSINIKQGDSSTSTGWGKVVKSTLAQDPLVRNMNTNGTTKYGTPVSIFKAGLTVNGLGTNTPTAKGWYGGSSYILLDTNSRTDSFKFSPTIKFWESKMGQGGIISVSVTDINDVPIIGYVIYKSDTKGDISYASPRYNKAYPKNEGDANISIGSQWSFGANNNEKNQARPNIAFNSAKGQVTMTKSGANLTWTYDSKSFSAVSPTLAGAVAAKVYISFGRPKTVGKNGVMPALVVNAISYTAMNAKTYTSAGNLYTKGSGNVIEMSSGYAYYNADTTASEKGELQNQDIVNYSEPITLPKGSSTLIITKSEWADWTATPPGITISFQEHYIG